MSKDIAVLGRESFVLGFQLAGVRRVLHAESPTEFASRVDAILRREETNLGILIVDAKDVEHLPAYSRKKLADSIEPVVVQMGGAGGDLREKVKRAIGIDLVKE